MTIKKNFGRVKIVLTCLALGAVVGACKVSYSLSGASIAPEIQTVSITYFQNNAALVLPTLSPTLTDGLKDRFTRQTRLTVVRENGDMSFEGEITNCSTAPSAISGNEYAVQNRLSVTVRVRFINAMQPQYNYDKSFTAYQDYPTNQMLQSVEGTLIPQIVDQLVEDIFNAAASNW